MNFSQAYLDRVLAHLSQVAGITHRRIFSGVSLYHQGVPFALVSNDRLYFCTDEHSRPLYQQLGMSAFQPRLATQLKSCFYQVPDEVVNHPAELRHWLRIAVESASPDRTDKAQGKLDDTQQGNFSSTPNTDRPLSLRHALA